MTTCLLLQRGACPPSVCADWARHREAAACGGVYVRAMEPARANLPAKPLGGQGTQVALWGLAGRVKVLPGTLLNKQPPLAASCAPPVHWCLVSAKDVHLSVLLTTFPLKHQRCLCAPPPSMPACLQKAAEYAVGGGKELNRVSYLSQARALYAYCLCSLTNSDLYGPAAAYLWSSWLVLAASNTCSPAPNTRARWKTHAA
jgi:hypothetical protein